MTRARPARRPDEAGFTLVELLAVIAILGVISFPLSQAFIVGLRTTDDNANNMARSVGVQALQSFFTPDAQSAALASQADPEPRCAAAAAPADVFLHLSWTDQATARDVSYSLAADSPVVEGQRELIRWSCTAGGPAQKRMLGRFTFDPAGQLPVRALCLLTPATTLVPCPAAPTAFEAVTLKVLTPTEVDLTVRGRTT